MISPFAPLALALSLTLPPDPWFGADKLKHFFVAAFTQTVAYSALQAADVRHDRAMAGAWAVTAAVSVAKELHDRRTTGLFSVRDLVWDAAGAGAISLLLERSVRRSNEGADGATALRSTVLCPLVPAPIFRSVRQPAFVPSR